MRFGVGSSAEWQRSAPRLRDPSANSARDGGGNYRSHSHRRSDSSPHRHPQHQHQSGRSSQPQVRHADPAQQRSASGSAPNRWGAHINGSSHNSQSRNPSEWVDHRAAKVQQHHPRTRHTSEYALPPAPPILDARSPGEALLRACSAIEFGGPETPLGIVASAVPTRSLVQSLGSDSPRVVYMYYHDCVVRLTAAGLLLYRPTDHSTFVGTAAAHYGFVCGPEDTEIPWEDIEDVREEPLAAAPTVRLVIGIAHTSRTATSARHSSGSIIERSFSAIVLDLPSPAVAEGILETVRLMSAASGEERAEVAASIVEASPPPAAAAAAAPFDATSTARPVSVPFQEPAPDGTADGLTDVVVSRRAAASVLSTAGHGPNHHSHKPNTKSQPRTPSQAIADRALEVELLKLRQREMDIRADIRMSPPKSRSGSQTATATTTNTAQRSQPYYDSSPHPRAHFGYDDGLVVTGHRNGGAVVGGRHAADASPSPFVRAASAASSVAPHHSAHRPAGDDGMAASSVGSSHSRPVRGDGLAERVRREMQDDHLQREVMLLAQQRRSESTTTAGDASVFDIPALAAAAAGGASGGRRQTSATDPSLFAAEDVSDLLRQLEREERDSRRAASAQRDRLRGSLPRHSQDPQHPQHHHAAEPSTTTASLLEPITKPAAAASPVVALNASVPVVAATATVPTPTTPTTAPSSNATPAPTAAAAAPKPAVVEATTPAKVVEPQTKLVPGPGWTAVTDRTTGKTYYANRSQNRTTWKLAETDPVPEPDTSHSSSPTTAAAASAPTVEKASAAAAPTDAPSNSQAPTAAPPTVKSAPPPPPPAKKAAPPPPPPAKKAPVPSAVPVSADEEIAAATDAPVTAAAPTPPAAKTPPPPPPPGKKAPVAAAVPAANPATGGSDEKEVSNVQAEAPAATPAPGASGAPKAVPPPPPPKKAVPPPPPPAKKAPAPAPIVVPAEPTTADTETSPVASPVPPAPTPKGPPPLPPGKKVPPPLPPGKAMAAAPTAASPTTDATSSTPTPASPMGGAAGSSGGGGGPGGKIYGMYKEVFDASKGRFYYRHLTTKEATWTVPDEVAALKKAEEEKAAASPTTATPATASPAAASPVSAAGSSAGGGPGGKIYGMYKEIFDASKGRFYYRHLTTKEATWTIPDEVAALKKAEGGTSGENASPTTAAASPVTVGPDGLRRIGPWVEKKDPQGRVYYANTATRTTTWKIAETPFASA